MRLLFDEYLQRLNDMGYGVVWVKDSAAVKQKVTDQGQRVHPHNNLALRDRFREQRAAVAACRGFTEPQLAYMQARTDLVVTCSVVPQQFTTSLHLPHEYANQLWDLDASFASMAAVEAAVADVRARYSTPNDHLRIVYALHADEVVVCEAGRLAQTCEEVYSKRVGVVLRGTDHTADGPVHWGCIWKSQLHSTLLAATVINDDGFKQKFQKLTLDGAGKQALLNVQKVKSASGERALADEEGISGVRMSMYTKGVAIPVAKCDINYRSRSSSAGTASREWFSLIRTAVLEFVAKLGVRFLKPSDTDTDILELDMHGCITTT
eukprot:3595-Heterococcus_DN1.PRE.1